MDIELKDFLVMRDHNNDFHIWTRNEYEKYIRGCFSVGGGSAYRIVTHFDFDDNLLSATTSPEPRKDKNDKG